MYSHKNIGIKAFADALKSNHKLKVFGFEANPVPDTALDYFVEQVGTNLVSVLVTVQFDAPAFQKKVHIRTNRGRFYGNF